MRTCNRCKTEKSDSEFYRNNKYLDGLNRRCKECDKELNLARYHSNGRNRPEHVYRKTCKTCGKRKFLSQYNMVKEGKYCAHCRDCYNAKARVRPLTISKAIRERKRDARKRDISWGLSDQECEALLCGNSSYCGCQPSHNERVGKSINGIDRIDSTLGYLTGNVVSCCFRCNLMKRELTVEQFKAQIKAICTHLGI